MQFNMIYIIGHIYNRMYYSIHREECVSAIFNLLGQVIIFSSFWASYKTYKCHFPYIKLIVKFHKITTIKVKISVTGKSVFQCISDRADFEFNCVPNLGLCIFSIYHWNIFDISA